MRLLIVEGMVRKRLEGPAGEPLEPKNNEERVDWGLVAVVAWLLVVRVEGARLDMLVLLVRACCTRY